MLEHDKIKFLVVHCSDTGDDENLNATHIHKMHLKFGWDGIGYHKIIQRNGDIKNGRPEYWVGAHVYGKNKESLGVCLIGRKKFTNEQFSSLSELLLNWKNKYPNAKVVGHNFFESTKKTCPNFDVQKWLSCEFKKFKVKQITVESASIKKNPTIYSPKLTEALFGESFFIKKIFKDWCYGYLLTDDYKGWIETKKLGALNKPTHKIISKKSNIFIKKNIKQQIFSISIGSKITVLKKEDDWYKIEINMKKSVTGFVKCKDCAPIDKFFRDWKKIPEKLLGTPYVWGGRTASGLDCSALVQLTFLNLIQKFPRDTNEQVKFPGKIIKNFNDLKFGDLIFWKGHVAFVKNKKELIHANATTMNVIKENISEAIIRIQKTNGKIKKILRI